MMNILVVSRELPYPLDHGCKIRMFNLLKHLSEKHNISLVCYTGSKDQDSHVRRMREFCHTIRLVRTEKRSKLRQLPGLTKDLISALPWQVKYAKSKEMKDTIRDIITGKRFDIIHFDDLYMCSNLDVVCNGSVKKSVTFHDIETVRFRRIFNIEKNPYKRLTTILNWLPMRGYERRIVQTFDLSIVVSPVDRRILESKYPKAKIAVIANGVATDSLSPLPLSDKQGNISFFGTMAYLPNNDGAIYFYKQIFPLIKKSVPSAKFCIVGQNPSKEVKRLSSDPSVVVTGYVEDVIPYYRTCSVVVVPLRAGGGTRGKILESMALGRPVVSTSLGAEGLGVTHKENIMIADRPEDFASMTIELMKDGLFKTALIERARQFVESQHSWQNIAGKLDHVYQKLCLVN